MVERHLERLGGTELLHHQMRSAFMTGRPETLDLFLHQYGASTPLAASSCSMLDKLQSCGKQLPQICNLDAGNVLLRTALNQKLRS